MSAQVLWGLALGIGTAIGALLALAARGRYAKEQDAADAAAVNAQSVALTAQERSIKALEKRIETLEKDRERERQHFESEIQRLTGEVLELRAELQLYKAHFGPLPAPEPVATVELQGVIRPAGA